MSERFSWTDPQLCHYDYDLKKYWFVYFDFTDNLTGHTVRKQFRYGINFIKTKEERLLQGNALKAFWKKKLKEGWDPFTQGEDLPITQPRITDAFDHILKLKTPSCGKRTIESYTYVIKLFREWLEKKRMENIFVYQFDVTQARLYMDYLTLTKKYSGRTFNDHLTVLSTFCNCMVDRDWIVKSPFRKIKKLPVEIGRNIAFSESEREELDLHLYNNDREMYYFTQFVYYCFIRRSELTRLKVENIDFKNGSIIIPSGASKNRRQESVVIPASFIPILKDMQLELLPPDWFIFGRYLKPGPVQYMNYNHISTRHNKITKKLKIDKSKGLYSWKHSGVCEVYPLLNGDVYALMRQLRHTELNTTMIYLKSLGLMDNTAIRNAVW